LLIEEKVNNDFYIREKVDLSSYDFLEIDGDLINIRKNKLIFNEDFIIPKGFKVIINAGVEIDLSNNAKIFSYSDIEFLGTKEDPIKIISSDKTGKGIIVYQSQIKLDNVEIGGMESEDSLNIINSEFEIENSFFGDCFSDCLDIDFGKGVIESSSFENCGNDCLNISGTITNISSIDIMNAGDKGISMGEKSNLIGEDIKIDSSYIGMAVKDLSIASIDNVNISNCGYGLAVYQKKSEFGFGKIDMRGFSFLDNNNDYVIEEGSQLILNKKILWGGKEKLFEELYPL